MRRHSSVLPMLSLLKANPTTRLMVTSVKSLCLCQRRQSINAIYFTNRHYLKPACTNLGYIFCRHFASLPSHRKVPLPALSPTMEKGNIVSWKKKEGDQIAEGDLLCEIETDKATMGFEASDDGYLAKIVVQEGEKDVPVGQLLCVVVEKAEDVAAFSSLSAAELGGSEAPSPPPVAATAAPPTPVASVPPVAFAPAPRPAPVAATAPTAPKVGDRLFASPLAKTLAAQKQIDIGSISGSGPSGRIVAADLSGAPAMTPGLPGQTGTNYTDIEVSSIRKTIAKRLTESKVNIPHYYLSVDVEMDAMMKVRERLNEELKKENKKLSLNDIIIKASALSCRAVPEVNSFWMDTFIRRHDYVDVSVAVMTRAGLITPIVFNADSKGLLEISEEMTTLGAKAKDGKLQPHEFQGGTFTVSNLGMFGVHRFSAIINPPQSAILAIGSSQKRVVFDQDKRCVEKGYMTVTLSCDHRVIDGAVGARWLLKFKNYMERPVTMLL